MSYLLWSLFGLLTFGSPFPIPPTFAIAQADELVADVIGVDDIVDDAETVEASPEVSEPIDALLTSSKDHGVIDVPFFSQFTDISSPSWKKIGCGITSLGMIMEYYNPGTVSVDELLADGIEKNAYSEAGWTYKGLIDVSGEYGFTGESHDLAGSADAFTQFKEAVDRGPVIASVYYTFEPGNPIPHLVVINSIEGETVYYNDPAEKAGGGTISVDAFIKAWKKRYIEIYPVS
ncbi:hypothetical protein A2392_03035 [Candidatus Kaiserbacteria bacterium RIFOXYB1_FULL_46_14]|uniref:Peptidase C39-like domain-containing protein n=1 Tax=Candidatus Kaiserbacteria bacterium RIFOXYB1_FULL_46_14 TaxID=1798531 RepID=A0A1F6FIP8_9BACT|nr:MAG: hypothetical protein A2392_03035 [Candidatus Kaiserbacteria bacterium RIFOXYB1_FULL_46_14]